VKPRKLTQKDIRFMTVDLYQKPWEHIEHVSMMLYQDSMADVKQAMAEEVGRYTDMETQKSLLGWMEKFKYPEGEIYQQEKKVKKSQYEYLRRKKLIDAHRKETSEFLTDALGWMK
jgi:tRNA A58 N-methylase Trm61